MITRDVGTRATGVTSVRTGVRQPTQLLVITIIAETQTIKDKLGVGLKTQLQLAKTGTTVLKYEHILIIITLLKYIL